MSGELPGEVRGLLAEFAAGSMVAGYLLEERIGAGGMAVVFRARDQRLGRLVALKIMAPALAADEAFRLRWAVAVALSRFGTLSPVKGIYSAPASSGDAYPHTPTITFYRSTYSSQYVAFAPVEDETDTKAQLQTPTPAEQALWNRYDPGNNFPFVDIGNKYVITDALYSPAVLAGRSWAEVTAALHDPSNPIAQGVDGAANVITAAICGLTGNQPSSVCGSSMITGLESRL